MVTMFRVLITHRDYYFSSGHVNDMRRMRQRVCDQSLIRTHQKLDPHEQYVQLSLKKFSRMHPGAGKPGVETTIKITSWTPLRGTETNWMNKDMVPFENCTNLLPWMKCSYLPPSPEAISSSHAVMFHGRHTQNLSHAIQSRQKGQWWLFYEEDPPTDMWTKVDPKHPIWSQFNLTATYTKSSDIPLLTNQLICRKKPLAKAEVNQDYSTGRLGHALWIADDCISSSQRELYVKDLQRHMTVDIFGACGQPLCGDNNISDQSICLENLLSANYKFLLVFESALCYEYVGFYLQIALKYNIIPVLLGLHDYKNMLLKDSYIDIRHFKTPNLLAQYLDYVDHNNDVFNRYIRRKRSMHCEPVHQLPFSCRLCHYLHVNQNHEKKITDVSQLWSANHQCWDPKRFYAGITDFHVTK